MNDHPAPNLVRPAASLALPDTTRAGPAPAAWPMPPGVAVPPVRAARRGFR